MRLIDADALIGVLHCYGFCDGIDRTMVYRIIESQPTIELECKTERWIPCSVRLPDREMPVWVSMCDDDVLKATWRNGWCAPNGYKLGLTEGQVIAWMPRQTVPDPFRKEGEQE